MTDFINKNDRQRNFAEVRGVISEMNDAEYHCSITLTVGHENPRPVNVVCKKPAFDGWAKKVKVGDKVIVQYFITSRNKNERWNTYANILDIHVLNNQTAVKGDNYSSDELP